MRFRPLFVVRLMLIATILSAPLAGFVGRVDVAAAPGPEPALDVLPAWMLAPFSDQPPPVTPTSSDASPSISQAPAPTRAGAAKPSPIYAPMAVGDMIEVFTNTWSYRTIGLVYDPGRDYVRYAHESQSSSHNPTVYDVETSATPTHTVVYSFALSTQNSSWPWQLDNRTGAGYDFFNDTYFLPDYNGDLSYADDNIVEIDADGNILNAWEMDDEVSSNDSADGSEIDSIIDIAVVPGNPTRYFATASYDGAVVYEIVLTRTGTLWTPNSWATVMTYTGAISDTFTDNLGIDYDAQNEVLYHSGWYTTTILVTDLSMNPVTEFTSTFDCPGAGGYNSGVTFVEGSDPPEIWVTDFDSDQTTRCEAPGRTPPPPGWDKLIDGQPYDPDVDIEKQMAEIITVTDVITAVDPFTLTETWNPDRLARVGLDIFPPVGQVITGVGSLRIVGPGGPPPVVTVTKWFRLQPCDWVTTTLTETLEVEGAPPFSDTRPVTIVKRAPELWIDGAYEPEVYAGDVTSFTLTYSNTGGFENQVWISSTFPITAPFIHADPFPDAVGPDGRWTRWNVGNLAQNQAGSIDVYVFISDTVLASNTVTIWDGIFNHVDVLQDETWGSLHVTGTLAAVDWEKYIAGQPWRPGISITRQTSDTFWVEDRIVPPPGNPDGFILIEEWTPGELRLFFQNVNPVTYTDYVTTPVPGIWLLDVPAGVDHGPVHVSKEFHIGPSTWPDTVLWEELQIGADPPRPRPVLVNKHQPELWLDGEGGGEVYGGDEVTFTLAYSNTGGRESGAWITSTFPAEATFVNADPMPLPGDYGDHWAKWSIGMLPGGGTGSITVTVEITRGLPPSTTFEMWGGILNHADDLWDDAIVGYHVPPPAWKKQINGQPWTPGLGVTVETSDTFTVTEVISTRSAVAVVEHWNPDRLALITYTTEPEAGIILSNTAFLSWEFPGGAPGEITITKWFRAEPCTWTYTVLWEELWVENVEWERRPVHIDKIPPDLHLESEGGGEVHAGQEVTFTLAYSNTGGYENDAWITSTFPISAPFASASLTPTREAGDGTWAAWDLDGLETGDEGAITVTVAITESLVEFDPVEIWNGVFHDGNVFITDTVIAYNVAQPPYTWTKSVDGTPWSAGISLTVETSDTIEVMEVITTEGLFDLAEHWDPERLRLDEWDLSSGEVITGEGTMTWHVPPAGQGRSSVVTLTKRFQVEPCTWPTTTLQEELSVQHQMVEDREVRLEKWASDLRLTGKGGGEVVAGELATFTLVYSNTGGYEHDVWIRNEFPPTAPFVSSDVTPTQVATDATWVEWDVGDLAHGARGEIDVTVAVTDALAPGDWITVTDWIYNHLGEPVDETAIGFHVGCQEVTSVALSYTNTGDIFTDTVVHFEADLTPDQATPPYSYTITVDGALSSVMTASAEPLLFTDTFPTTGTHTVEVAAWNCGMTEPVTDTVTVTVQAPAPCIQLDGAPITGPTSGPPDTYTFTATSTPLGATPPITYLWDDGATTQSVTRTLTTTGSHTLMVTATNPCTLVTATHTITITAAPTQCIPVSAVDLTLETSPPILTDTLAHFGADIAPDEADKPYTYTIDYDDGTITTTTASADPLTLAHTFEMTGAFTVEIAAWNCDLAPADAVTDSVTLTVHPPGATFSHIYLPLVVRNF